MATAAPTTTTTATNPTTNTTTAPQLYPEEQEFQKKIISDCAEEVFKLKAATTADMKKLTTVMKKYEDLIYERYIKKTTVATLDKKMEKEDLMNASMKYPFVGDASFLTNYNRLLRGYKDESQFLQQQQQVHHNVQMPSELGIYQPNNRFPSEQKSYVDTQANSKHYFPQDFESPYTNANIYNNKPINDISNQQHLYMSQFDRPGFSDPYNSQSNFYSGGAGISSRQMNNIGLGTTSGPNLIGQGIPNQQPQYGQQYGQQYNNRLGSPLQSQFPGFSEEELRLRRNVELLGGIERTIPNMERSLRDNELKNIEQNFKFQTAQFDNSSNARLNNLLQHPMSNVYAPQFGTPGPNVRSQSPLRSELPDLNRNPLMYSPQRSHYAPENDLRQSMPVNAQTQPQPTIQHPLFEKSMNHTPKKPSFASSKAMRSEKSEILNVQYQIPENWGLRGENN